MAKPKRKKIAPFFGSGVLVDSVRRGESGKVDVLGVFTIIYAWATPFTRIFNAVLTLFNLPPGKTSVAVSISKKGSHESKLLEHFEVKPKRNNGDLIITCIIKNKFEDYGFHEVIFSFRDYPGKLLIPFEIRSREWPEFSKDELDFVKQLGDAAPSFRVNIHCSGCNHAYIFEEQLNPYISPKGGVHRFPEDSVFMCEECNKELNLRDIRGQLRAALKDTISKMRGKS